MYEYEYSGLGEDIERAQLGGGKANPVWVFSAFVRVYDDFPRTFAVCARSKADALELLLEETGYKPANVRFNEEATRHLNQIHAGNVIELGG